MGCRTVSGRPPLDHRPVGNDDPHTLSGGTADEQHATGGTVRPAAIAAGLVVILGVCLAGAAHAASPKAAAGETVMCDRNEWRPVGNAVARNPYWDGVGTDCVLITAHGLRLTRRARGGLAYPSMLVGCLYNVCSPSSPFPKRVSSIRRETSTVSTHQGEPGTWNAAYDGWFGARPATTGHPAAHGGAELMIWLNHHGSCCWMPGYRTVWIGGMEFRLTHWITHDRNNPNITWPLIQFRAVHAKWRVTGLNVKRFIQVAERYRLIRPAWFQLTMSFGFESWTGCVGCAVRDYRVVVR